MFRKLLCSLVIVAMPSQVVWAGPVFNDGAAAGGLFGQGTIAVDVVPGQPGPYFGGEQFTVDVWLTSSSRYELLLGFVRFDFINTHGALTLGQEFTFDFSELADLTNQYHGVSDLPYPWTIMDDACFCPGSYLPLLPDTPLRIGYFDVGLPIEPGTYLLDVFDTVFPDPAFSAEIISASLPGVAPGFTYSAVNGLLVGGVTNLVVVPEPVTLPLLAIGFLVMSSRWFRR